MDGSATAWLVTVFSLVVAAGVGAVGVWALLNGYTVIAVLALIATLGIVVRAVARFTLFRER